MMIKKHQSPKPRMTLSKIMLDPFSFHFDPILTYYGKVNGNFTITNDD